MVLAGPTAPWYSSVCVDSPLLLQRDTALNHHLAPATSFPTDGAGYLKHLVASVILLTAVALGVFIVKSGETSRLLTWQLAVITGVWFVNSAAAWHFLRYLPQGELDFDGERWYFVDQTTQLEQIGTISVRFDIQDAMLLRFENEFKHVSWLWFEAQFANKSLASDWHELRRAVYSRPASQNSLDFI